MEYVEQEAIAESLEAELKDLEWEVYLVSEIVMDGGTAENPDYIKARGEAVRSKVQDITRRLAAVADRYDTLTS